MPVVKAEPPLALAEVVGSVTDRELLERAFHDPSVVDRPVGEVMDPPLPTIGLGRDGRRGGVAGCRPARPCVVLDDGHPTGILTRSDLLDFLARGPAGDGRRAGRRGRRTAGAAADGFETLAIHAGQRSRPGDRRGRDADLPDLDLRPGGGGRAQGLRVQPQRQPDPHRARALPGRAGGRRRTASPSPAGWPARTPCSGCWPAATTC